MEKEVVKSYIYKHGQQTYIMAWVVELCLFFLGIALAIMNVLFALEGVVSWTNAFILATGWVFIATIELATIPLAGSLRLASWKNKPFAVFGLIGLIFLSSFTVYEFNEIASEVMTRGARESSIKVEKIKKDIGDLQYDLQNLENDSIEADNKRVSIRSEREQEIADELDRFSRQKKGTEDYYKILISQSSKSAETPIYNQVEKVLINKYNSSIEAIEGKIASIKEEKIDVQKSFEIGENIKNANAKALYEAQLSNILERRKELQKDEQTRIDSVESSFFRSKEKNIKTIQNEFLSKRKELDQKEEEYRRRLALLIVGESPKIKTLNDKILSLEEEINKFETDLAQVEEIATKRMDDPETQKEIQFREEEKSRVYNDRSNQLSVEERKHKERLEEINNKHQAELDNLSLTAKSAEELIKAKNQLDLNVENKKQMMSSIIEETAIQYEKTMYFRMASWFSEDDNLGFGKLPNKGDYNRSLLYIFLPIGVFFALVSIVLAYLGTGFKFEESIKNDKFQLLENIDDAIDKFDRIAEIESNNKALEDTLARREKTEDDLKLLLKKDYDNELEKIISNKNLEHKLEIEKITLENSHADFLRETINDLKAKLNSNEKDLVIAKQRVFEAIRSIPQSITIVDEAANKKEIDTSTS